MRVVPFGILLYIGATYPGYFNELYFNFKGVLIMTGCLVVYLAAYLLGEKMMKQVEKKLA